jgi:hypothetical protein
MTRRRTPASTGDSFDVDEALAAMNAGELRALDLSSETTDWVIDIREKYRRYAAFQRELAAVCGITSQD